MTDGSLAYRKTKRKPIMFWASFEKTPWVVSSEAWKPFVGDPHFVLRVRTLSRVVANKLGIMGLKTRVVRSRRLLLSTKLNERVSALPQFSPVD